MNDKKWNDWKLTAVNLINYLSRKKEGTHTHTEDGSKNGIEGGQSMGQQFSLEKIKNKLTDARDVLTTN